MPQTADDFIRFRCPCGVKLKIPAAATGRRIRCPKCSKTFLAATDQPAPAKAATVPPTPAANEDNLLSDLLAAESSSEAIQAPPSADKATKCPNCGSAMAPQAPSCGVCGYTKVAPPKSAAGNESKSKKAAKVAGGLALGTGRFMVGTLCSFVGALIGALIWFGVAWMTDISFGLLAWLVGILAGVGMRFGYGNENVRAGLVAALMTFVGVVGGQITVFAVVVMNDYGGGDIELVRESVTVTVAEQILDERKVYSLRERTEQRDAVRKEAADRVARMDDEEVQRLYKQQNSWTELLDFDPELAQIAFHRTERRTEKEGLENTDRRHELYYKEELAKAKSLSKEQIATAKAEIEAWDAGKKWEDPDYVREFLVDAIATDLASATETYDDSYDEDQWYKEWEARRETARAQVDAMTEAERLERARQIEHDEEEEMKKFMADLDISTNGVPGVGSTLVGGALIVAFFFMMFGLFDSICVLLAVYTAYKVASSGG